MRPLPYARRQRERLLARHGDRARVCLRRRRRLRTARAAKRAGDGAARTADGGGYRLLFSNGVVAAFGDAKNLGDPAGSVGGSNPATAIFTTSSGGGYWIASANGAVNAYGDAPNDGSMAAEHLNGSIVAATGW